MQRRPAGRRAAVRCRGCAAWWIGFPGSRCKARLDPLTARPRPLSGCCQEGSRMLPAMNIQTGSTRIRPLLLLRSEEHTSELQSLMRISYAVFCLHYNITKNIHKHTLKNHYTHRDQP